LAEARPYATAAELRVDLDALHRSLFGNGSVLIARGRLRALRRAVGVFGFHSRQRRSAAELGCA